jgi:hypothetical protein
VYNVSDSIEKKEQCLYEKSAHSDKGREGEGHEGSAEARKERRDLLAGRLSRALDR